MKFYDGTEDLEAYLAQFQIIFDMNNWNYQTKSLKRIWKIHHNLEIPTTQQNPGSGHFNDQHAQINQSASRDRNDHRNFRNENSQGNDRMSNSRDQDRQTM